MDSLPGPLGQVIINLVNNAYLHAFDGQAQGVLTIGAVQSGGRICMAFSDNGAGMSEDTQVRLFQPFFSTKTGQGGTGLGMMIVDDLVRKVLGGVLGVQSTAGLGTTVRVDLPLVAPAGRG
jgi:signal transduction histidine kinase